MPSITFWSRLEPRPRSMSIARALRAEIRDPAWFLARQWQLGEFQGADSGSPAYTELTSTRTKLAGWRAGSANADTPIPDKVPLEALILSEGFSPEDQSLRVELAQSFEAALRDGGISEDVIALYAPAYPLPTIPSQTDPQTQRFVDVCQGRSWNGLAFLVAARTNGGVPPSPVVPPASSAAVKAIVLGFIDWAARTYGVISATGPAPDPIAWTPERLRYSATVTAPTVAASQTTFAVAPGPSGELDWYSFDETAHSGSPSPPDTSTLSVIPTHVRFKGMPNARFWDFERAGADYAAIETDRRDLARLVLTEFALTQSNDWFLVPLTIPVGSILELQTVLVYDVFGGATLIRRANADPIDSAAGRWNMFTPTRPDASGPAPYIVLPDTMSLDLQAGDPVEDVRFVRDELANMAWAIERIYENGLGVGRSRRDVESQLDDNRGPPPSIDATSPVRYIIQNEIPLEWTPFVPVRAGAAGPVALRRGLMLTTGKTTIVPIAPLTRIVATPTTLTIREEEIPRTGVRITREAIFARTVLGVPLLFYQRQRRPGHGEGNSGLQFDAAVARRGP